MINPKRAAAVLIAAAALSFHPVKAKNKYIKHSGLASYHTYDEENNSRFYYRYGRLMGASRIYPCGTVLKVFNKKNKRSVKITIADWGPARRTHRVLDLNKLAFKRISNLSVGVINVSYYVLKLGNCNVHRH